MLSHHLNSYINRIKHTVKTQPNCMCRKTFSFKTFFRAGIWNAFRLSEEMKFIPILNINCLKDGKLRTDIPPLLHFSLKLMITITNHSWPSDIPLQLSQWGWSQTLLGGEFILNYLNYGFLFCISIHMTPI